MTGTRTNPNGAIVTTDVMDEVNSGKLELVRRTSSPEKPKFEIRSLGPPG